MPRLRSLVSGFASPNLPNGASQIFNTPSRGARNDTYRPSGLNRACARTGLPNSAERWIRGASRFVAATAIPPLIVSTPANTTSQRMLMTVLVRRLAKSRAPAAGRCETRFAPSVRSSVQQHGLALRAPCRLVGGSQRLQVGRRRLRIVHPATQQVAAVDHVDGQPIFFVLVRKIAP